MLLVAFLVAITSCQIENSLKEERVILAHSLQGESIMVEQARRLVHKFGSRGEAVLGLGVLLHRMVAPSPGWVFPP